MKVALLHGESATSTLRKCHFYTVKVALLLCPPDFLGIRSVIFFHFSCVNGKKVVILQTVQRNEGLNQSSSFYFISLFMIEKNLVKSIVEEWLEGKDYFLVDVEVSADDRVVVEIDHADGVWIEDCVELSRFIEERMNRDDEDYELEVGSAGLGQPFKVPQQYVNCIGKQVEVLSADGIKLKGELKSVEDRCFTIATQEKQKVEGKKRPVLVDVEKTFSMDEVKYCKYIIDFK